MRKRQRLMRRGPGAGPSPPSPGAEPAGTQNTPAGSDEQARACAVTLCSCAGKAKAQGAKDHDSCLQIAP
eukprot:8615495-Alexandrium_andersonii.AAC.1